MNKLLWASCLLVALSSSKTLAQSLISVNSDQFKALRFNHLTDTACKRSLFYTLDWSNQELGVSSSKKGNFYFHPLQIKTGFNTAYPRDFNNGPLWSGKGLFGEVNAGISYRSRNLEVTFWPTLWYAQNKAYDLEPLVYEGNRFRYPFSSRIDWPQRFGEASLTEFSPGQSRIKYTWNKKLYAKLSTENMWFGPSYSNAITMTNTAPGFPHFSLGIDDLLGSAIGDFGASMYWGRLAESSYFNNDDVDSKYFSALTFEYHPSFIDGFQLGFSRVVYSSWENLVPADFFKVLSGFGNNPDSTKVGENDEFDQLTSLLVRWRFPEIGFEAFYEYTRNDFGGDLQNTLIQFPDHSRFYSFGFAKTIHTGIGPMRFLTEFNNLSRSDTRLLGPSPVLYVHPIAKGGYTHQGQLVGAPVGPGSNSQFFGFTLDSKKILYELFIRRITWNDDYFYQNAKQLDLDRDVEMILGLGTMIALDNAILNIELEYSDRGHWYYHRESNNLYLEIGYTKSF